MIHTELMCAVSEGTPDCADPESLREETLFELAEGNREQVSSPDYRPTVTSVSPTTNTTDSRA